MINHYLRTEILNFISRVVFVQVGVVACIGVLTLFLLLYRRWFTNRKNKWKQIYGDLIVEELLRNMEEKEVYLLPKLSGNQWLRRTSLKDTLLIQIRSISGAEKAYLVKRYFDLGLAKSDLATCTSVFWWRRLQGLANLRVLADPKLAPCFALLKKDKNELVAMTANLALSELDHYLNYVNPLELRSLLRQGRQSNLAEITANWCQVHGFDKVFKISCEVSDPEMRDAMLVAILNVKTPESSQALAGFLSDAHYESPELLARIISSLRETGDPEALPAVIEYAHHPDERVQARAIEFILEFLPEERRSELRIFELDPSPFVQRILRIWSFKKAA